MGGLSQREREALGNPSPLGGGRERVNAAQPNSQLSCKPSAELSLLRLCRGAAENQRS